MPLALRLEQGRQACVTRIFWMSAGETAAVSTTYMSKKNAATLVTTDRQTAPVGVLAFVPLSLTGADDRAPWPAGEPSSSDVDMQRPPAWAAKALRIPAFDPATVVTAMFSEATVPVALTTVILRPDAFRITASSGDGHMTVRRHRQRGQTYLLTTTTSVRGTLAFPLRINPDLSGPADVASAGARSRRGARAGATAARWARSGWRARVPPGVVRCGQP